MCRNFGAATAPNDAEVPIRWALWLGRHVPEPTSLTRWREQETVMVLNQQPSCCRRGELARCVMPQSKAICNHCGARAASVTCGDYGLGDLGIPIILKQVELVYCSACGNLDPIIFRSGRGDNGAGGGAGFQPLRSSATEKCLSCANFLPGAPVNRLPLVHSLCLRPSRVNPSRLNCPTWGMKLERSLLVPALNNGGVQSQYKDRLTAVGK